MFCFVAEFFSASYNYVSKIPHQQVACIYLFTPFAKHTISSIYKNVTLMHRNILRISGCFKTELETSASEMCCVSVMRIDAQNDHKSLGCCTRASQSIQRLLVAAIKQQEGRLVSCFRSGIPLFNLENDPHPLFNLTIPKLVPFDTLLVCLWLMCKFNEEVADLTQFILYDI
jgi:hypothetical protein